MSKPSAFRFSVFTLLVVVTLAAVSVSHVRTSWELAQSRHEAHDARRQAMVQVNTIRRLNDALGRLTISDTSKVHVINASPCWREGTFDSDRPPNYSCWNFYLPEGTRWKVWWATQAIPAEGLPELKEGGFELRRDAIGQAYLGAQFSNAADFGLLIHASRWELLVSDSTDMRDSVRLSPEAARWLSSKAPVSWSGTGGDQDAAPHTAVLSPDGPIVLLRIRSWPVEESAAQAAQPRDGFMIWLEPWQP